MKRTFIESTAVRRVLDANGVSDEQVREMEKESMIGRGSVIGGTGGIRKIRCGAAGRGKSGGVRVALADYPHAGRTYLLAALSKGAKGNFTKAERNELKRLKQALDRAVRSQS